MSAAEAPRAHIVGAGLAGLSAAVALAKAGHAVQLSDAAAQAGGRCRSYHDPQLGVEIDNGNHLVLSGNRAVMAYLATIGAEDRLDGPDDARLDFQDVRSGESWSITPSAGPIPWWLLARKTRVPGTRLGEYLALARLLRAGPDATIGDTIRCSGPLWDRLLEPFLVAALNTPPREGSAALAGAVVRETLAKGGRHCRPRVATPTLAAAFVDPALAWLAGRGATVRLGRRLKALETDAGHVTALIFADGREPVAPGEPVVLAVPAWIAAALVPGLAVPDRHHAIVNAHFLMPPPPGARRIVGVIGGLAEWIFAFPDRLSVTISAADRLLETDRESLARAIWADVAAVHALPPDLPTWQIVREKRATFSATPAQEKRRGAAATSFANLFLAGDWTNTGLPATIEGAIRSGETAARLAGAAESGIA
ncbi:hydroxysqualene dehydroxylase HpnE [Sphingomonas morindae]|uniref:Hydroxysqualene dehydroxylase HpnE n=1 Tax=Sphingomonas morindae TaxID=1541170 RepID=A0ABY4X442_9SPHN|nr:hydroxysqualene dehydroxylase HpnE [Sphingomonas morindae]USI71667.1 hydroxysqualene dehydroxylase HpnE [Sphingomonas morindae]